MPSVKLVTHNDLEWIGKALAFYGCCSVDSIEKRCSEKTLRSFAKQLKRSAIPLREIAARRFTASLLRGLPYQSRTMMTNTLKRFRNPRNREFRVNYPKDFEFNILVGGLCEEAGFEWNGCRSAVCVTHDVDNETGYDFLPNLLEINRKRNVVATVNFLANADYKIEQPLLGRWVAEGNEVGLHGYDHDIGLAYRSGKLIKESLSSAIGSISIEVKGFRSPALSSSQELYKVLEELGLSYDSSIEVLCPFYRSAGLNFPYPILGRKLWEIPLAIQDDYFFRDFSLSDRDALKVLHRILVEIHELRSVAVLLFHPHIIAEKRFFYEGALDLITSLDDTWITTMGSLFDFVSTNYREHQEKVGEVH